MSSIPKALLYKLIIRPRAAKAYAGMIALPQDTQEAQQASAVVGQVLDMGALAFRAQTPGLDYSHDGNAPTVGSWVVYSKYAGQTLKLRKADGTVDTIIIIADSDLHAVFKTEEEASRVIGYVE